VLRWPPLLEEVGRRPLSFILLAYLAPGNGTIFALANFMKPINLFLVLVIFLGACSSSKKTTAKKVSTHKVTRTDVLKGGTSFENAIVIRVEKESTGVAEEYKWLAQSYPGYSTIRKTQSTKGNRHYDIIKIKTRDGWEKDIYFDTTSFFGKG
jgi:hypothetical protein